MSNSLTPNPTGRGVRPGYLVAALVIASMMGLGGLTNGCHILQFYRQDTHPSPAADSRMTPDLAARVEMVHQARVQALNANARRMIPLAAANTILSLLLIAASSGALAGRARSHWLALQAVTANFAFPIVDSVLERPLRSVLIDAASRPPPGFAPGPDTPPASMGWGFFRSVLAVQLVPLALIALALTRPRVLAWLDTHQPEQES